MKKKLSLTRFIFLLFFITVTNAVAQNINAPFIEEGDVCARSSFNSYTSIANLSAGGSGFPVSNQFILQLSDETGSFEDDIIELARVTGPNGVSGAEQEIRFEDFSIPVDLIGSDEYRLRVIASESSIMSALSDFITMYYHDEDNLDYPQINNGNDIYICDGASFSKVVNVTIADYPDRNPLDPNDFDWQWFKDPNPDGTGDTNFVEIPGETETSLTINSVGRYKAQIALGGCLGYYEFYSSNRIKVAVISESDITISTTAPDFSYCPSETKELVGSFSTNNYEYQWLKDDNELEGEVSSTIELPDNDFGGEYTLRVTFSDDCQLISDPVTVTNEGSSITDPLPENLILLPNQTINLEITTTAPEGSSIVTWRVNTTPQGSAPLVGSTSSFDATFTGNYRVDIDTDDACNTQLFSETEIFAPTSFEMVIGTQGDVSCDDDLFTLELLEMSGRIFDGRLVLLTDEQFDFFDFEWYKDGVSTGNTSLSLQIDRTIDDGGSFELRADLRSGEFTDIISNSLTIDFLSSDITLEMAPGFITENGVVTLTAPENANFTYEWYEVIGGQEELIEGEVTHTIVVDHVGDFFVRISSLLCSVDSLIAEVREEAGLSEVIPNVITPEGNNANNSWILPSIFNQSDVEVTIYSATGKLDYQSSGGYNAEWPENSASDARELIYYYLISRNNTIVRKGTITVMR